MFRKQRVGPDDKQPVMLPRGIISLNNVNLRGY